jgi:hypothetical protein
MLGVVSKQLGVVVVSKHIGRVEARRTSSLAFLTWPGAPGVPWRSNDVAACLLACWPADALLMLAC